LKKLETELKKKNIKQLWVSSVPETASYYKKHGFKVVMNGKINGNPKTFLFKKI